ncbi:DUF2809 domain-containing protein [Marinilabiliaceae bacterium JC017]|nr:DUF2809 domain-containing protein [Marinilabiliaceae bacterium JC017]
MKRNRLTYLAFVITVILLGLATRQNGIRLPHIISEYGGDTLWGTMVYAGLAFLFTRKSCIRISLMALLFSYAIELSQLYHAPWIDAIRNTTLGGLILGFGFKWSDIVCYSIGIGLGVLCDQLLRRAQDFAFNRNEE